MPIRLSIFVIMSVFLVVGIIILAIISPYDAIKVDCHENFSNKIRMTTSPNKKTWLYECFHLCVSAQKFPERKRVTETFKNMCTVHLKEAKQFSTKIMQDSPVDMNCFETIDGKTLVGLLDFLVKDVMSLFECQKHCTISHEQHGVLCKSAIFYSSERECAIIADNRHTMPDLYINDPTAVYIENKCTAIESTNMAVMKDDKLPAIFEFNIDEDDSKKHANPDLEDHGIELDVEEGKPSTRKPEPIPAERSTGGVPPQHMNLPKLVTPPALSIDEEEEKVHRQPVQAPVRPTSRAPPTRPPTPKPYPTIESSGYDNGVVEKTGYNQPVYRKTETIDAKTLDSYGMEEKSPSRHEFVKRFHDEKTFVPDQCFTEIFPSYIDADKIFVAKSLERCIEQCRSCTRCIKNRKCEVVGFEIQKQRCALARKQTTLSQQKKQKNNGGFTYFKRGNC